MARWRVTLRSNIHDLPTPDREIQTWVISPESGAAKGPMILAEFPNTPAGNLMAQGVCDMLNLEYDRGVIDKMNAMREALGLVDTECVWGESCG